MATLKIRRDRTPTVLRKLAKDEPGSRISRRLLAIANALDGMSRADAANSAGMDRQTLRDWVLKGAASDEEHDCLRTQFEVISIARLRPPVRDETAPARPCLLIELLRRRGTSDLWTDRHPELMSFNSASRHPIH